MFCGKGAAQKDIVFNTCSQVSHTKPFGFNAHFVEHDVSCNRMIPMTQNNVISLLWLQRRARYRFRLALHRVGPSGAKMQ